MHDSISHLLMQCHANGYVYVARQRLRTVNVRNKLCCVQSNCLVTFQTLIKPQILYIKNFKQFI